MTLHIPQFDGARVLVAGDVMLDRYWVGPTGRVSPEAPVPVVRVSDTEDRPGGAANVAVNLATLGVGTRLVGVTGADEAGARLRALLEAHGIGCTFDAAETMATTTKLRVLSRNQQLLRMDFEVDPSTTPADGVVDAFRGALDDVAVAVLSDYGKGTLAGAPQLIELCRERDTPVLVDPKGTDFERYRGATAITPNLAEFEAVMGHCPDEGVLVDRARDLRDALDLAFILITRSDKGMTLVGRHGDAWHLAAEAREVFDVTGAGDTVIATLAAGMAAGLAPESAAALANLAAGLVVRKIGVAAVTPAELRLELHQRGKGGRGLVTREQLADFVSEAKARGERIVMTNGCFDILHAGHVAYLEEAKALGNRLIVAVNDDPSVTRLKGEGRPVNPLEDRMAVLAGLASVDWVVPFSEDTPEALICHLLPHVLVKGGDYRPEQIAGHQCVLENGGEVRVLTFRDGRSTSGILDRLSSRD